MNNTTPRLGLKKPHGDDFYNIQDHNHNADLLDQQVARLVDLNNIQVPVTSVAGRTGNVVLNKNDVGLGNVDNVKQATKSEFDSHVADYEYQVATVVSRQIRVTRQSTTNIVKFKLETDIPDGTGITISLDNGVSSLPLREADGTTPVTRLRQGFHEVIANATFFTFVSKGDYNRGDYLTANLVTRNPILEQTVRPNLNISGQFLSIENGVHFLYLVSINDTTFRKYDRFGNMIFSVNVGFASGYFLGIIGDVLIYVNSNNGTIFRVNKDTGIVINNATPTGFANAPSEGGRRVVAMNNNRIVYQGTEATTARVLNADTLVQTHTITTTHSIRMILRDTQNGFYVFTSGTQIRYLNQFANFVRDIFENENITRIIGYGRNGDMFYRAGFFDRKLTPPTTLSNTVFVNNARDVAPAYNIPDALYGWQLSVHRGLEVYRDGFQREALQLVTEPITVRFVNCMWVDINNLYQNIVYAMMIFDNQFLITKLFDGVLLNP